MGAPTRKENRKDFSLEERGKTYPVKRSGPMKPQKMEERSGLGQKNLRWGRVKKGKIEEYE